MSGSGVMDQKMHESLEKFMAERNPKDEKELNDLLQEFINLYNSGELDYEDSPMVQAYELLEQAHEAKSEKEKMKLVKQALAVCPDCLDAKLILATESNRPIKVFQNVFKCISEEKERLKKEGYFAKDNIGHFYLIYETRPYIRAMYNLAHMYANAGMINKAILLAKEIIRLNENDNTGTRYLLMGLYAYKEEIDNMNKLYNKYKEDSLHILVPYMIYYYKQGEYKKAIDYLEKIKNQNKYFVKYFEEGMDMDATMPDGYTRGDISEVEDVVAGLEFLFSSVPDISELILEDDILEE